MSSDSPADKTEKPYAEAFVHTTTVTFPGAEVLLPALTLETHAKAAPKFIALARPEVGEKQKGYQINLIKVLQARIPDLKIEIVHGTPSTTVQRKEKDDEIAVTPVTSTQHTIAVQIPATKQGIRYNIEFTGDGDKGPKDIAKKVEEARGQIEKLESLRQRYVELLTTEREQTPEEDTKKREDLARQISTTQENAQRQTTQFTEQLEAALFIKPEVISGAFREIILSDVTAETLKDRIDKTIREKFESTARDLKANIQWAEGHIASSERRLRVAEVTRQIQAATPVVLEQFQDEAITPELYAKLKGPSGSYIKTIQSALGVEIKYTENLGDEEKPGILTIMPPAAVTTDEHLHVDIDTRLELAKTTITQLLKAAKTGQPLEPEKAIRLAKSGREISIQYTHPITGETHREDIFGVSLGTIALDPLLCLHISKKTESGEDVYSISYLAPKGRATQPDADELLARFEAATHALRLGVNGGLSQNRINELVTQTLKKDARIPGTKEYERARRAFEEAAMRMPPKSIAIKHPLEIHTDPKLQALAGALDVRCKPKTIEAALSFFSGDTFSSNEHVEVSLLRMSPKALQKAGFSDAVIGKLPRRKDSEDDPAVGFKFEHVRYFDDGTTNAEQIAIVQETLRRAAGKFLAPNSSVTFSRELLKECWQEVTAPEAAPEQPRIVEKIVEKAPERGQKTRKAIEDLGPSRKFHDFAGHLGDRVAALRPFRDLLGVDIEIRTKKIKGTEIEQNYIWLEVPPREDGSVDDDKINFVVSFLGVLYDKVFAEGPGRGLSGAEGIALRNVKSLLTEGDPRTGQLSLLEQFKENPGAFAPSFKVGFSGRPVLRTPGAGNVPAIALPGKEQKGPHIRHDRVEAAPQVASFAEHFKLPSFQARPQGRLDLRIPQFKMTKIQGRDTPQLIMNNGDVYTMTPNHVAYLKNLLDPDCRLAITDSPWGTSKTFLAALASLIYYAQGAADHIVYTRPAIAAEDYGFLPGSLEDKTSVYYLAMQQIFGELIGEDNFDVGKQAGVFVAQPLGFMRGQTLKRIYGVMDEGQNGTRSQINMFMTRGCVHSYMALIGDSQQIDLKNPSNSGFRYALEFLPQRPTVFRHDMTDDADVVRSGLAKEVMLANRAYLKDQQRRAMQRARASVLGDQVTDPFNQEAAGATMTARNLVAFAKAVAGKWGKDPTEVIAGMAEEFGFDDNEIQAALDLTAR